MLIIPGDLGERVEGQVKERRGARSSETQAAARLNFFFLAFFLAFHKPKLLQKLQDLQMGHGSSATSELGYGHDFFFFFRKAKKNVISTKDKSKLGTSATYSYCLSCA